MASKALAKRPLFPCIYGHDLGPATSRHHHMCTLSQQLKPFTVADYMHILQVTRAHEQKHKRQFTCAPQLVARATIGGVTSVYEVCDVASPLIPVRGFPGRDGQ